MADAKTMGIFDVAKRGLKGVFHAPSAVFLGVGAEISGAIFSIGLTAVFGAFLYSWMARALTAVIAIFLGEAAIGDPAAYVPHPGRFLVPLAAAVAAATAVVLFMKALWVGAAVRGTVRSLKLKSEVSGSDSIPQPGLSSESPLEKSRQEEDTHSFYALREGITAFPKILPVAGVFLPIAAAVLFVCASIMTMTALMLHNLLRDGIGSKTILLTLLALILGGSIFFGITRGCAFWFRMSAVRALALGEDPIQAASASARQLFEKFRLFIPIFMVFGLLKFFAVAGDQFSGSIWGGVLDGGSAKVILAVIIYVAAAFMEAALCACITSAEYGVLTSAIFSEAGLIVPEVREASGESIGETRLKSAEKKEAAESEEEILLETSLVREPILVSPPEGSQSADLSEDDEPILETILLTDVIRRSSADGSDESGDEVTEDPQTRKEEPASPKCSCDLASADSSSEGNELLLQTSLNAENDGKPILETRFISRGIDGALSSAENIQTAEVMPIPVSENISEDEVPAVPPGISCASGFPVKEGDAAVEGKKAEPASKMNPVASAGKETETPNMGNVSASGCVMGEEAQSRKLALPVEISPSAQKTLPAPSDDSALASENASMREGAAANSAGSYAKK